MHPSRITKGVTGFTIQFTDQTDNENNETQAQTYELPDISESFEMRYRDRNIIISNNSMIDIRVLGRGHYADNVMLCEIKNHPDLKMAVKKLALCPRRHSREDFTTQTDLRTIRSIGSGDNEHVTRFYGAYKDREFEQLVICMEPCDTSVSRFSDVMHKLRLTRPIDLLLKRMISHISDALNFLKSRKILHRDVKPSNILINRNPVTFKLCDFGISAELIDSAARTMMKGTQIYLAPERVNRELAPDGYRIQSDMWSLGLSALQIASNQHPFQNMEIIQMMGTLKVWQPNPPANLSAELRSLICWMLKFNHQERPSTYDEILSNDAIRHLPSEVTEDERATIDEVINTVMESPPE